MTRLSVNINKVATLRNARGGNTPNVLTVAKDCERFGADGITVHPRPDERHIKYQDVIDLKQIVTTEFNIEGYPDDRYLALIEETRPDQATLVPDPPDVLTSNAGWKTIKNSTFLQKTIATIKEWGCRVSLFIETDLDQIKGAKDVGADRIELYTEAYAANFVVNKEVAVKPFVESANYAQELGLRINAGHDLNLDNLKFLKQNIPFLDEVSIGHALISDALYLGLENTIQMYRRQLIT